MSLWPRSRLQEPLLFRVLTTWPCSRKASYFSLLTVQPVPSLFLSSLPLTHRTTYLVRRSAAGPLLPATFTALKADRKDLYAFHPSCPQSLTLVPFKAF